MISMFISLERAKQKKKRELVSLFRNERYEECLTCADNFLKQFPYSLDGWIIKGNLGIELNDKRLARKAFFRALKIYPNSDKAYVGLGILRRLEHDFEGAEDYYYKALKVNPDSYAAKSSLMLLEIFNGNLDVAIALGEDSIKADVENVEPSIVSNLVLAYHMDGSFDKRDKLMDYLESIDYKYLYVLEGFISGEFDFYTIFEQSY
jgi:tetratricopeptide (TPR) repeat protein